MKMLKRILALIAACLMLGVLIAPAFAEEVAVDVPEINVGEIAETPAIPENMNFELFTWQSLATVAGSALATVLFVQIFKNPLDKLVKIPTSIFAYVVALAIQVCATAFTVGITAQSIPLAVINALVVTYTAIGFYEKTFGKVGM